MVQPNTDNNGNEKMETKKKFYQTDTFKYAVGLAVGALLYKIVTGLFF
jgi:hypothetical protein